MTKSVFAEALREGDVLMELRDDSEWLAARATLGVSGGVAYFLSRCPKEPAAERTARCWICLQGEVKFMAPQSEGEDGVATCEDCLQRAHREPPEDIDVAEICHHTLLDGSDVTLPDGSTTMMGPATLMRRSAGGAA